MSKGRGFRPKGRKTLMIAYVGPQERLAGRDSRVLPLDSETWATFEWRLQRRGYTMPDGTPGLSAYVFHRNDEPIGLTVFGKQ